MSHGLSMLRALDLLGDKDGEGGALLARARAELAQMRRQDAAVLFALAQLRHAYGNHHKTGQPIDPGLLESAIRRLEEGTTVKP